MTTNKQDDATSQPGEVRSSEGLGRTAAYTPGPWVAHFEEAYYATGPDLGRVAMMMNLKGAHGMGGRRSGAEAAANCRLVAAAPDLLAAALNALDILRTDRQAFVDCSRLRDSRTEEAIAHGLVLVDEETWVEASDAEAIRDYDRALAMLDAAVEKAGVVCRPNVGGEATTTARGNR